MGIKVEGVGLRIEGFRVWGFGFKAWEGWFRVGHTSALSSSRFQNLRGLRVSGCGFLVSDVGIRACGLKLRALDFRFWTHVGQTHVVYGLERMVKC